MSNAKSGPTRQQRSRRAYQLRERGLTWAQIADIWEADYPDINPRRAFRWAHDLSYEEVAERWNMLDPGEPTMTKSRIYEFETWPTKGGRRPSAENLRMLARIFQTTGERLLTQDEISRYKASDRSTISRLEYRHLDENCHEIMRQVGTRNLQRFSLPDERRSEIDAEDDEWQRMSDLLRRAFLKRGLAAITLPAIGVEELKHVAVALTDARRYADMELVSHFKCQLADYAANDRMRGPKRTIPMTLGLVAAIEETAKDAGSDVRRSLLRVGAQVAEFMGWLYRDIATPDLAGYWRDRAVEWAQAASDFPMQGYVLLKKSQAAWDERDALRMLTLVEATQEGPWQLPLRVKAEAVQQVARGQAMLSKDSRIVEDKIKKARELLAKDTEASGIAAYYDESLLGLQTAICYCEAGQP
jgi:hypothetical protein